MKLQKSVSRLTQEEIRAKKFELIDLLTSPEIQKRRTVVISRKRMESDRLHGGEFDPSTQVIVLNPDCTVDAFIAAYVHENLHYLLPESPERTIKSLSDRIVKEMSIIERQHIFRLLAAEGEFDD